MRVGDARCEERFHDNPLVTGTMGLRFYAGVPLDIGTGERIGALCVLDVVPRQLNDARREALAALARRVVAQISLRDKVVALQKASTRPSLFEQQLQRFNEEMQTLIALRTRELQQARDRAELYFDVAGNMMVVTDAAGRIERANCRTGGVWCRPSGSLRGEDRFDLCYPAQERAAAHEYFTGLIDPGSSSSRRFHGRVMTSEGQFRAVSWHTTRLVDERGIITGLLGMGEDITARLEAEGHLRRMLDGLERSNMGCSSSCMSRHTTCASRSTPSSTSPSCWRAIGTMRTAKASTAKSISSCAEEHACARWSTTSCPSCLSTTAKRGWTG